MPIDVNARARLLQAFAAVTSLVVTGALAQTAPAPAASGAMQFKNVRVVNAPERASVRQAQLQEGFRAYIDPATRQLAAPDHEEVAALDARLPRDDGKPPAKALGQRRLANGLVGVRLDASSINYSVVRRSARGALESACVQGHELAEQLMRESLVQNDDGSR